ncbi:FAD-dependent oxidoreductase [Photobacterium sp. DNB23_23_1]
MLGKSISDVDVCIIGAGPAGMSAAITCAEHGANVAVIDEQPQPGGQIYRSVSNHKNGSGEIFGPDYLRGADLVERFQNASISYFGNSTLWRIDSDKTVYWSENGLAYRLQAKRVIIATGASERPFPFPGWTLPGVMTAGACQAMMKASALVPNQAVMVGTGPLLYLLAAQMIDAGAAPKAIVDTQHPSSYFSASKHIVSAWQGRKYLYKGLKLLAKVRRAGVKHYTKATNIKALGESSVNGISFEVGTVLHEFETEILLCHIGVIPNVQLTRALSIKHNWDSVQCSWSPVLDDFGNSSLEGIAVAGDGRSIGGALVAEKQGQLAGLASLNATDQLSDKQFEIESQKIKQSINSELAIRPFLDALYRPPEEAYRPAGSTIVCRCENVTAKQIRDQIDAGVNGINQIKAYTRCGMGPCQGRHCGTTVSQMISDKLNMPMEKVGYYRIRNPIKPLTLGELASLTPIEESFVAKYKKQEIKNGSGKKITYESTNE